MVIKRVKGDTFPISIQIVNDQDEPVDLTGSTVFFTVKRRLPDPDTQALISKTITSHTDPTEGFTEISLTENDTDLVGEFDYDIKVKDSTGIIFSVFKDKILFIDHVTIRTS